MYNKSPHKNASSKYLGVSLNLKRTTKKIYAAKIGSLNIGYYYTEAEAALSYNREAVRYHKEFANLNVITP